MKKIYPESWKALAELSEHFLVMDTPESEYPGDCLNCGGLGFMYYFNVHSGPFASLPRGTVTYIKGKGWFNGELQGEPCPVCSGDKKEQFLKDISGLEPGDFGIRLKHFKPLEGKENAREIGGVILSMTPTPIGLYTFWGDYGVGKTTILKALTNGFRIAGVPAVYKRMADILDEVRDTYSQNSKEAAGALIKKYRGYQAAFIDEVDRIYQTEWALDTMFTMLDDRYNRQRLTLTVLATNSSPDELAENFPYLASRISEGVIVEIAGADVRPAMGLKKQKELGLEGVAG